jgi:hypothetical protein
MTRSVLLFLFSRNTEENLHVSLSFSMPFHLSATIILFLFDPNVYFNLGTIQTPNTLSFSLFKPHKSAFFLTKTS